LAYLVTLKLKKELSYSLNIKGTLVNYYKDKMQIFVLCKGLIHLC